MSEQSKKSALNTAANVLNYKNRSRRDLLRRLLEKDIDELDATWAVEKLCEMGYLNDVEYANTLVRTALAKGYGARRVKDILKEKGISQEDIDVVMQAFSPNEEKLCAYIQSKLYGKTPDRRELKKVSDGLFRRGFSWEEINAALRQYTQSEDDFEN